MSEFRPIPSVPNYEASDEGLIRNATKGNIIKAQINKRGYAVLEVGGKTHTVHKLVTEAFFGKRPDGKQVNHKNGVRNDNSLFNLEYVTGSENMLHAYRTGLQLPVRGERHGNAKLKAGQIEEMRKLANSGLFSQSELGIVFGVNQAAISRALNRKSYA